MTSNAHDYDQAKQLTSLTLRKLVDSTDQLTYLSLPERSALIDEIARVVPAGNVPSLVVAGLANLPDRIVPIADTRRNFSLLMQGMQAFLDKAVYRAFFDGPARILAAYQMLLTLAGKDLDQSFPEGTWQFYVEFGIREDSGRHACETTGFRAALLQENLHLSESDQLVAWLLACGWLLEFYPLLLANEWNEHVYLRYLTKALPDETITARWFKTRPYAMPADSRVDFTQYRQYAFELFCNKELARLSEQARRQIQVAWNDKLAAQQRAAELAAYQHQMTILASIAPGEHCDMRVPLSRDQLNIAVIVGGRYYLVSRRDTTSVSRIRMICAAILRDQVAVHQTLLDDALCTALRRDQTALRKLLPGTTQAELEQLRTAPIIVNWDAVQSERRLADIRSGKRGIGDHALTLFRTSDSMVFDQSHIFFDGGWGMAAAEIMTNQAVRYARDLADLTNVGNLPTVKCLTLQAPLDVIRQAHRSQISPEVSAENTQVRLDRILQTQRHLRIRNSKLRLTVNDILVLYRSLFGTIYRPSAALKREIKVLVASNIATVSQAGTLALNALEAAQQPSPALLLPIDATLINPRERVYPTTFRNPFNDLLAQHRNALTLLGTLEETVNPAQVNRPFIEARRNYLATLYAFAQLLKRYKDVSLQGESVSTATIKLLAGLPISVQRMLDGLPSHIDILNDIVKGQEVFSNVGQVALSSSLRRFNTAKDDNEKKVLAWGVMTDAQGVMHISLRDARPHVGALDGVQQRELAQRMAQEYLDAFASGLNRYMGELTRIARADARTSTTG